MLDLAFLIRQENKLYLERTLLDISNETSLKYRKYWDHKKVSQVTESSTNAIFARNYLVNNGATCISITKGGEYLDARANISLWEKILNTTFYTFYSEDKLNMYYRTFTYTLPFALQKYVDHIFDLIDFPSTSPRVSSSSKSYLISKWKGFIRYYNGYIYPQRLQQFYQIPHEQSTNNSIGIFDGFNLYFSSRDVRQFHRTLGTTQKKTIKNQVNDAHKICEFAPLECLESNLLIEYITALAPHSDLNYWCVAMEIMQSRSPPFHHILLTSPDRYLDSVYENFFLSWIKTVTNFDNPPKVILLIYSVYEGILSPALIDAFNLEAIKLALQGVTILTYSGDDGAAGPLARYTKDMCGLYPMFPASSPYVTVVGGSQGVEYGEKEVACQSNEGGGITSGGGFSNIHRQPLWQFDAVQSYLEQNEAIIGDYNFNSTGRAYPDISLSAAGYLAVSGGRWFEVSGTALAAAVATAMISVINSKLLSSNLPVAGYLNPILYSPAMSCAINDILSGDNFCTVGLCCPQGFSATTGWDPVTGLGSLNIAKLLALFGLSTANSEFAVNESYDLEYGKNIDTDLSQGEDACECRQKSYENFHECNCSSVTDMDLGKPKVYNGLERWDKAGLWFSVSCIVIIVLMYAIACIRCYGSRRPSGYRSVREPVNPPHFENIVTGSHEEEYSKATPL